MWGLCTLKHISGNIKSKNMEKGILFKEVKKTNRSEFIRNHNMNYIKIFDQTV